MFSTITFSQETTNLFMRAETFRFGYKNDNGAIIWTNGINNTCDVLFKFSETQVTVFSKTPQVYHILKFDGKDGEMIKWSCVDNKGKMCKLYVTELLKYPGKLGVAIEFSDYIWTYVCRIENN